jgi:hypothetical protein
MSISAARFLVIGVLVAGLGLLAAGCGGTKPAPSVASLGTTSTPTTTGSAGAPAGGGDSSAPPSGGGGTMSITGGVQQMTRFAACMRKNGEPSFPDPNAQGEISANLNPGSAQFQQAQQACRKLLPNGGTPSPAQQAETRQHALAFSACMRSHGEPNFPDPQFGAGGTVTMRIRVGSGLDPQSPQFQAAQKACQKNLPGKLGTVGVKTPGGGASNG